jgi:hypothetical protein
MALLHSARDAGKVPLSWETIMGLILESTPEMGEYSVEVRRESFYLRGADSYDKPMRHAIELYPSPPGGRQGTVEILIEDIPKIRAALDEVERAVKENWRGAYGR